MYDLHVNKKGCSANLNHTSLQMSGNYPRFTGFISARIIHVGEPETFDGHPKALQMLPTTTASLSVGHASVVGFLQEAAASP